MYQTLSQQLASLSTLFVGKLVGKSKSSSKQHAEYDIASVSLCFIKNHPTRVYNKGNPASIILRGGGGFTLMFCETRLRDSS